MTKKKGKHCGAVDELSGAKCTLFPHHEQPHHDESVWGCEIYFKDVPKLIVPSRGTLIGDGIIDIPIIRDAG